MQNWPLSVMFGLGHMAKADTTIVHMCNVTHEVVAAPGLYVRSSTATKMPAVHIRRECHVTSNSWIGSGASLVWHPNEATTMDCSPAPCTIYGNTTLHYTKQGVKSKNIFVRANVAHPVTHLIVSGLDVWLAGGHCVTSLGHAQKRCIADTNFTTVAAAANEEAVYLMNSAGDVYVMHHIGATTPKTERLLNVTAAVIPRTKEHSGAIQVRAGT